MVLDYAHIERERKAREAPSGSCWAFGAPGGEGDDGSDSESHNAQVAKIIACLGTSGSGRRAVIKAIAERQGVDDPEEL